MLSIEEYFARRKKEDRLDEFDLNARADNMRICVNYVFEYFNNYLNITEAEERTALRDEKIMEYDKKLRNYEPEIRDWLVRIYSEYGKQIKSSINSVIKKDRFFYLYSTDSEFRSLSYDCYSQLIKKLPFLKDQTEMLFLFIKDHHRILSQNDVYQNIPFITENITEWIEETRKKHQVNIIAFIGDWLSYFSDNDKIWPSTHKKKDLDGQWEYDYKQKRNLFNIDSLYRKMPKKSFIKGKKQEFEILMMYFWLHGFDRDEDYWQEYLGKTLPTLKQE